MKLTLPTKQLLIVFFLLISFFAFSQENKAIKKMEKSETSENKSKSFLNQGVRGSFGGKYQFIDSSGDKYVGLAYEGNGGFGIALKLFVYDGFFIGGTFGSSYFKNINKSISGNYDKTRVNYTYLFLGYEYKIIPQLAIGISSSVYGSSSYKNSFDRSESYQYDYASVRAYEVSVDFFIDKNLSVNLSYIYRNDKTKINTSPNLQSSFDRAQFSIIGLGINFQFGKDAIFSSSKKK